MTVHVDFLYLLDHDLLHATHVDVDARCTSDFPGKSHESLPRKGVLKSGAIALVCSVKRFMLNKLN